MVSINSIFFLGLVLSSIQNINSIDFKNHDCLRTCSAGGPSKNCRYDFYVSEFNNSTRRCNESQEGNNDQLFCLANKIHRSPLAVNGKSPGPSIEICLGDTLEVYLYNKLNFEVSFHWHGLRQKGFVHMDGVPMVTQCPILPFSGFRYKMKPDTPGTYFYHAHSVLQQADGLYGALIVRTPKDDHNFERILQFSSRTLKSLTSFPEQQLPVPSQLLINDQENGTRIDVKEESRYLFRFINAAAFNCPISFSVAKHQLKVATSDGNEVESVGPASHIIIFPGERLDAIIETNQTPGKYQIVLQGLIDCRDLFHEAHLFYLGSNAMDIEKDTIYLDSNMISQLERGYNCDKVSKNLVCSLDLRMKNDFAPFDEADQTVVIPFDVNNFETITDEMTDENFNIYDYSYYPSFLSLLRNGTQIPQINGMTFQYPSSPILSQPENTPEDLICSLENRSKMCENTPVFCECVQILELPQKKIVDLIFINEGFGGNTSFTFHVHGYSVNIIGRQNFEQPISRKEIISMYRNKKLRYNLKDPPRKDTFVVPNKGYVILRFQTDNHGYWLWEVRSTGISPAITGPGMQFLMRVGSRENLPMVPLNFPTCGNNKKPGMIFETEIEI